MTWTLVGQISVLAGVAGVLVAATASAIIEIKKAGRSRD
jgi:hypothetical protein